MSGTRSDFQAARWNEDLIMELSEKGQRGIVPPAIDADIAAAVGDVAAALPASVRRTTPLDLPEVTQHRVLRHFMRLSQMSMGFDNRTRTCQNRANVHYQACHQRSSPMTAYRFSCLALLAVPELFQALCKCSCASYGQVTNRSKR